MNAPTEPPSSDSRNCGDCDRSDFARPSPRGGIETAATPRNGFLHTSFGAPPPATLDGPSALLESLAVPCVLLDPVTLILRRVNTRCAALTGYSKDELTGVPLADLLPAEARVSIFHLFSDLARRRILEVSLDQLLRRKDGRLIWVNLTGSLLAGTAPGSPAATVLIQDVSARKLAEERLSVLRETLAVNAAGIRGEPGAGARHPPPANPVRPALGPGEGGEGLSGRGLGFKETLDAIAILRESERQLELNLTGMTRLQALSTRLVSTGDFRSLLAEILSASADLTGTNKGTIEFFDEATGKLELVVHQGLGSRFIEHISRHPCAATWRSLRERRRVVIDDVATEPTLRDTPDLDAFLGDDIRAVQSTPLVSREGRQLGTLNNHFGRPYRPAAHEIKLLDLLARMAADFIERSQTDAALRESEARFRRAMEIETVGIVFFTTFGVIVDANDAFLQQSGYGREDLEHGRIHWDQMTPPEWIRTARKAEEEFKAMGRTIPYERQCIRKDGTRWWALLSATRLDPNAGVVFAIDITQRKEADEELRRHRDNLEVRVQERTAALDAANGALRDEIVERQRAEAARQELQLQLASAQEEERRRISRELHDEVGQHITALMLGLKSLESTRSSPPSPDTLASLQAITETVGKEIHDLALELRPTALDDLGLLRTLSHFIEEWSARSRIEVDFHSSGWAGDRLAPPIETTVYRIVQEALTNILRHAHATRVSVIIERRPEQVTLIVEDDGIGFDIEILPRRSQVERLGLLGMKERAELMSGEMKLESSPGKGTTVFVRIPVPPANPC